MITIDELIKTAQLAKLSIAGEDLDALARDMTDIMDVAGSIDGVDLSQYDCTGDAETTALREDIIVPSLPVDLILQNAGGTRDGFFAAPFGGVV